MKISLPLLLILLGICQIPAIANAQQFVTVTGTVTGDNNAPLPGVTVLLKGSAVGTTSGANGEYKIAASDSATLVFSYIGYTSQQVPVQARTTINVKMISTNSSLSQVVVVGYGTQRKGDITSAISTVDVSDVGHRPIVSTAEVLQGKAPGVQVTQPSGAPGSDLSVRVRGIASPNGAEPLYVIDGVITTDTHTLDPNDIASITVLKDAAAAGIYGAAGSTNGVVEITTKHGIKGKTQTSVTAYTGMQQILKKLPVLNGPQYISLMTDEYANAASTMPSIPSYLDANNNWQNLVYHPAWQTDVNASFSGGSSKGTWFLGMGYLNQDGIVHTSNFKRYSADFKLEQSMNDWLTAGGDITYNRAYYVTIPDGASAQHGGTVLAALTVPPIVPIYYPAGVYASNFDGTNNPVGNIYDEPNSQSNNNLLGNFHVEINLPAGLKYRSQAGVNMEQYNYNYFLNPFNNAYGISITGEGINTSQEVLRYVLDNTLTWDRSFGLHTFNVVLGTETINEKYYNNSQSGRGFATAAVPTLNAATSNQSIYSDETDWADLSYFGRLNYSFEDKYLFTGTFRADGSSRVGINNKWGYFPAFSAGWRVSRENFMQNVDAIQDLKIRAGWGETGNLPPTSITDYPSYSSLNPGAPYVFSGAVAPGAVLSSPVGNPNLKWEAGQQLNVGMDITVLKGRLTLSADYYNKRTTDLIFPETLPATSGNDDNTVIVNLPGYDRNTGEEFALTGDILRSKHFTWRSTVNMAFNKNKITGLDTGQIFYYGGISFGGTGTNQYVSVVKNGLPLGAFWGYKALGVNPQTGNETFADLNHDGIIDPTHDRTYLGSGLPTLVYSWVNNLDLNGFGLELLFDGVGGGKIFNATRIETEGMSTANNASTAVLNRWRTPGQKTNIPIAIFGDPGATNSVPNESISSRFVESGNFVRLRSATLSYTIASSGLSNIGISGIRIYVTGQNLFFITRYSGYTPEVNQAQTSAGGVGVNNSTALGIDYGVYPESRIYTVGTNVTF